jgi:ABC-2 type transport system ATP-binding protein
VSRSQRKAAAAQLLDQFGLADRADDKVDWYSGGMAQRLMIARALMHEPKVLFLDEPTTGLDPQARLFVWDRVRELRQRGVTIVLTTHDMDEAAELSDRVGIIDHGKLLALDTPAALTRGLTGEAVLDLTVVPASGDDADSLIDTLSTVDGVERVERVAAGGDGHRPTADSDVRLRLYLTSDPAATLAPVVAALAGRGGTLSDVHIGEPSLEDVFIHLTGRGLR